jgi:hypothetical protein
MKIRADWVTNSSSVSYIVTLNQAMAEFVRKKNGNYCSNQMLERVYDLLAAELKQRGKPMEFDGADLLMAAFHFEKKKDCLYDATLAEQGKPVDYAQLTDQQMWGYIYGEFFVKGRLSSELKGFGAVQAPRDKVAFASKAAAYNPCSVCGKCEKGKENSHADAQA